MKLLNRNELNSEIEKMIHTEKDFVLLLSPFIDLSEDIINVLHLSKAEICLIISDKDKNNIDEIKKMIPKVNIIKTKNLHAKIYMSSSKIIVTSMNLYEYSQIHNFEIGLIFDNNLNDEICKNLYEELEKFFGKNSIKKFWLEQLYYTKHCPICNRKMPDNYPTCSICKSKNNRERSNQNANRKT
jgi:phosphatidylserine/phosphatidylglycerophosphate/cardiolipin synthase-like enzyme